MDKLQFKDMIAHYDPNRNDPDGYLQYRVKRRRNGAMSEEKDKDGYKKKDWAKDAGWHKPKMTDRFGNVEKDSNTALAHARRLARLAQLKAANMAKRAKQGAQSNTAKASAQGLGILGLGLEEVEQGVEQIDEISLDDLTKAVGASSHLKKVAKAQKSDKLKLELEKMRKRLSGKDGNRWPLDYRPAMATRKESVEDDEDFVVDEALNMAQRLKRGRTMKRVQKKVQMGRKRASRRMANLDTLKRRAVKSARKMLLKRLSKGANKEDLSPARKMELEKKLSTPAMKKRIKMISMKMLKDVRERETERHKNKKSGNK